MTASAKSSGPGRIRDTYFELVRRFPLRPLHNEKDLDEATAVIDGLLSRKLDYGERQYLEVLTDLVEKYENAAHPIRPASDSELLAFLMEQGGRKQTEVAGATGIANSTISEVLSGKRKLTREQVGKVAALFNVEPAAFSAGGD